jgi:hypothetical protein
MPTRRMTNAKQPCWLGIFIINSVWRGRGRQCSKDCRRKRNCR